jgi:hypothetical protein
MGIKIETKGFAQAIQDYMLTTNRGVVEVLNAKAFEVVSKAMGHTPRTTAEQLTKEMRAVEIVSNIKADPFYRKSQQAGKLYNRRKDKFGNIKIRPTKNFYKNKPELRYAQSKSHGVPAGFLIANYRRKLKGKPGLGGREMGIYFDRFIKALRSSAGYIRAGWIPALELFRPWAKSKEARMAGLQASKPLAEAFKKGTSSRLLNQEGGVLAKFATYPIFKAFFYNAARGADIIEQKDSPLKKAIFDVEMDMRKHLTNYYHNMARAKGL